VLVAAVFFAAIAPTLPWQEFTGGSETLVVETVLEMRRGGPWFIPTLQGMPRLNKPPWTAWLTALAVRPDTVERLSRRDPAGRDAAFRRFAWQVRWPTLLSACAMLLVVYALGETLFGRPAGLTAALACGGSLLFLRFCRSATTDVQLALWVAAANALLSVAVLRRRYWLGFIGAGAALGLSLMSKGPVGLVQSVLPFGLFAVWKRLAFAAERDPDDPSPGSELSNGRPVFAIAAGVVVMLAVALPWPLAVVLKYPNVLGPWWKEITREGATQLARDPWYTYFVFLPWLAPWIAFLIGGLWIGLVSLVKQVDASSDGPRRREGLVLAMLLVVVPLAVMSFAKDKNERYALPMVAPAAVLAAGAAVGWWKSDRRDPAGRLAEAAHWATLVALAAGLPVLGLLAPRVGLGDAWFTPALGALIGIAALAVVGAGLLIHRREGRRRGWAAGAFVAALTSAVVMVLLQYPFMRAYGRVARSDLKPLADAIWAQYPDAVVYEYEPGVSTRTYLDLPIYAGRVTTKHHQPWALAQTDRPQVMVFFERRGDVPQLGGAWKEFTSGGGRKNTWQAYVLPAAGR
jgi:4-amino-4-deoxy-L-arabinose transferase-like glycosyltransferase